MKLEALKLNCNNYLTSKVFLLANLRESWRRVHFSLHLSRICNPIQSWQAHPLLQRSRCPRHIPHQHLLRRLDDVLPHQFLAKLLKVLGTILCLLASTAADMALDRSLYVDCHWWVAFGLLSKVVGYESGIAQLGCFVVSVPATGWADCIVYTLLDGNLASCCFIDSSCECWVYLRETRYIE